MKQQPVPLSPDLESLVVGGLLSGTVPPQAVTPESLSHLGRYVLDSLDKLGPPPYSLQSVLSTCVDVFGADADKLRPYLKQASLQDGKAAVNILRALRDRTVLLDLANIIAEQLADCELRKAEITRTLDAHRDGSTLAPLSDSVTDTPPELPTGVPLRSLPRLTQATGGMYGMWAISGDPGIGKTTLAVQIVLHTAQKMPVVYYDLENGEAKLLYRIGAALGDTAKVRQATRQVYLRTQINKIDDDMASIPPPALIVVDSIQKVPVYGSEIRAGVSKWVKRLEAFKLAGYSVLLLSEKDRSSYGQATLTGYKETGSIEYSMEVGIQLVRSGDDIEVHIVKNRDRQDKDYVCTLYQEPDRPFWFSERTEGGQRENL